MSATYVIDRTGTIIFAYTLSTTAATARPPPYFGFVSSRHSLSCDLGSARGSGMPCKTAVARTPLGSKFFAKVGMCLVTDIFQVTMVQVGAEGTAMTKLGIFTATILAAAGACCGVEARAADAPKRAPAFGTLSQRTAS